MVISYAQDRPVTTAVADTFDGQHPCKLCKGIAKGKSAEKKAEFQLESSKVKFANEAAAFVFSMPPMLWEIAPRDENAGCGLVGELHLAGFKLELSFFLC